MADKSMKVTYREYVVEADEKGSISVTKNGEACDNAKGALREIAQLAGFEVDPNWTSRQFGSKLMKFLSENPQSPTPIEEPAKEIITEKVTTEEETRICVVCGARIPASSKKCPKCGTECVDGYRVCPQCGAKIPALATHCPTCESELLSINSEEFCKNDQDLKAFYKEWKSYTKEKFDSLLRKAEDGDVIAQYKCGYIFAVISDKKYRLDAWGWKLSDDCKQEWNAPIEHFSSIVDLTDVHRTANKWLRASAKQGFGLAMFELGDHYLHGPQCDIVEAVQWKERCERINPWRSYFNLYCNFDQAGRQVMDYPLKLKELQEKEKSKESYVQHCLKEMDNSSKLKKRVQELEEKCEKLTAENEALRKKSSSSSYSSSSSSSSRSSSDERVRVEIKYKSKTKLIPFGMPHTKTVIMTKAEYKSLRDGSMKARIAYVTQNCGVIAGIEEVSEVSVSLL